MPYKIKSYPTSLSTLSECQTFIKSHLLSDTGKSKGSAAFRYVPNNLWIDIKREAELLGLLSNNKAEQVLWIHKNYNSYPKKCLTCNNDIIDFESFNQEYKSDFCSVSCSYRHKKVIDKKKATSQKNFGTDYPCQSKKYQNEMIDKYTQKYGVNHPMQNVEVFNKVSKKVYKKKSYVFPSGKQVMIMGYENFIIDWLLNNDIKENDIVIEHHLSFKYNFDNKSKVYFPDIFISSQNLIIEVKSSYTYKADLEKNLLKRQAVIDAGYNFNFYIWDNIKKEVEIL